MFSAIFTILTLMIIVLALVILVAQLRMRNNNPGDLWQDDVTESVSYAAWAWELQEPEDTGALFTLTYEDTQARLDRYEESLLEQWAEQEATDADVNETPAEEEDAPPEEPAEPERTYTPTASVTITHVEPPVYYDIPLSDELQAYTYSVCAAYGIEAYYELELAKLWRESNFRYRVISPTNDWGIAQINEGGHSRLRRELGITDFLDPFQSILAGVHVFAPLLDSAEPHLALMSYNMGSDTALRIWNNGTHSSRYSRNVVATWETLLTTGGMG